MSGGVGCIVNIAILRICLLDLHSVTYHRVVFSWTSTTLFMVFSVAHTIRARSKLDAWRFQSVTSVTCEYDNIC